VLYALAAAVIFLLYHGLQREPEVDLPATVDPRARKALATSRRTVLELAALFSLDSAGSGFVVTSLLVLWLHLRFDLSAGVTAAVFFASGLLGACSQLLAPRLARRVAAPPSGPRTAHQAAGWWHRPAPRSPPSASRGRPR